MLPGLVSTMWLPVWRWHAHPSRSNARRASRPETTGSSGNGYVHLDAATNLSAGQLDWFDGDDVLRDPDSTWGVLSADVISAPTVTQFLNVVADAGRGAAWVVQNLPLLPQAIEDPVVRLGVDIDFTLLGFSDGEDVSTMRVVTSVDRQPRRTQPTGGATPASQTVSDPPRLPSLVRLGLGGATDARRDLRQCCEPSRGDRSIAGYTASVGAVVEPLEGGAQLLEPRASFGVQSLEHLVVLANDRVLLPVSLQRRALSTAAGFDLLVAAHGVGDAGLELSTNGFVVHGASYRSSARTPAWYVV
jgi:hypothetical protein